MEDEVEFSGRTVEEAIVQAERELGVSRQELQISVVTPGRSGVFGIGAEPARISVVQTSPTAEPEQVEVQEIVEVTTIEPVDEFDDVDDVYDEEQDDVLYEAPRGEERTAEERAESNRNLAEEGREVLRELLDVMGFDADVQVRDTDDPIMLVVTGEDLGVLIGRRGDNLAALQFMVNLILSKNRRQWPRIVVDIENYRERREESLRSLAERIAHRVRRNGRAFTLEAMPAGDRRIIHLTLRDARDLETYSIGEGPSRRVVVAPIRAAQGEARRASS